MAKKSKGYTCYAAQLKTGDLLVIGPNTHTVDKVTVTRDSVDPFKDSVDVQVDGDTGNFYFHPGQDVRVARAN